MSYLATNPLEEIPSEARIADPHETADGMLVTAVVTDESLRDDLVALIRKRGEENAQLKLLADYIMAEIPGEPRGGAGGAAEVALRLLKDYRRAFLTIMSELGVPDERTPAPVAYAYEKARDMLVGK